MPRNTLTCYVSGIGVFRREYALEADVVNQIRIPIRKQYRGDLIASLRLFGPVRVVEPVSWPRDADVVLDIDPVKVERGLLESLSGRRISFTPKGDAQVSGINMGLESFPESGSGKKIKRTYVIVLLDTGVISRFALDEIRQLAFTEEEVQAEINRALLRRAIKLRPQLTYATIGVKPDPGASNPTLWVQYATPFPAWQPTYRIDCKETEYQLEGLAKIDYDGEEDLPDCQVKLVVGEPDTFETDLAESKIPARERVNLVQAKASGGYVAEDGIDFDLTLESSKLGEEEDSPRLHAMRSARAMAPAMMAPPSPPASAKAHQAEATELGDYSVWTTAYDLTLRSQQSALIPLFNTPVKEAERVLYYNHGVNTTRPKLALQFTNPMTQALGKGVCTIYEDGELTGTCILSAVKPGESTLLIYGTETGVTVQCRPGSKKSSRLAMVLAKGKLKEEEFERQETTYAFQNRRPRPYTVLIDHTRHLYESKVEVPDSAKIVETLQDGSRIRILLPAQSAATLIVRESAKRVSRSVVTTGNWENSLLHLYTEYPIRDDKALAPFFAVQSDLKRLAQEVEANQAKRKSATENSQRLLNYLANPHAGSIKQIELWQEDLQACHQQIQASEAKAEALAVERRGLIAKLEEVIKTAALEWKTSAKE